MHFCLLSWFNHVLLCHPMDYNPLGFPVRGILQARILEWVAMHSSRGSSWPRDRTLVSCLYCIAGGFFTAEPPGKPQGAGYPSMKPAHWTFCLPQHGPCWSYNSLNFWLSSSQLLGQGILGNRVAELVKVNQTKAHTAEKSNQSFNSQGEAASCFRNSLK